MKQSAWVHAGDGQLESVGGSGSGTEREYQYTWELIDRRASRARVVYLEDGVEVGSESLVLDPADRSGYFAARLPDGSFERLPVGRAHRMWRLRWVRSDVPRAEVEDDDEDLAMPHERFVRLRSAQGSIEPVGASGAIGGSVQYFDVEVADTERELEIDYVVGVEFVVTEKLPLPDIRI
jgi:hypothetical protein